MSSREVQCEGLGMGLTLDDEGHVCAFIALGDIEDVDMPTHVVRFDSDRLNYIIRMLMSISNEFATLESELADLPESDHAAFLRRVAGRYNSGAN